MTTLDEIQARVAATAEYFGGPYDVMPTHYKDRAKLVKAIREVEAIMDQLDIDRADGRIVMAAQIQQAVRDTIREALG